MLLAACLCLGCDLVSPYAPVYDDGPSAPPPPTAAGSPALGDGFVVWESNRTGAWRIWTRRLDGSGLRQLSRDEEGRHHCCPHIAPDGRRVVYLSRTVGGDTYPKREVPGDLRLVTWDGGEERTVLRARTYGWGNRAAVWRDASELVGVDAEGRTILLDVDTGAVRTLQAEPREELGWLVDPTLRFATNAAPSFSPFDAERGRVLERQPFGGCEPYFSHDGRWGFWIAGAGGPIQRMDLESREIEVVLRKNDPRIPGGKGYVYFPMPARDGRLFAFAGSAGQHQHDHFTSDYDVYVAPSDPETFELVGDPVRMTVDPATDRYPDVFARPLELGRLAGEAPFEARWNVEGGEEGDWQWEYGDGATGDAPLASARHSYGQPGLYEVRARRGGEVLRGQVQVDAPRPPRVLAAALIDAGRRVLVRFDETVRIDDDPEISFASGRAVAGWHPGEDGRSLMVDLAAALETDDRLRLAGVSDRAQVPNAMPPAEVDVAAPAWPSVRQHLVFLWQTGEQPNLVSDPESGLERSYSLEALEHARLDHHYRMVLGGGAFRAPEEAAADWIEAVKSSQELSLEVTLETASLDQDGPATVVALSENRRHRLLTLGQQEGRLVLYLRTNVERPLVDLFALEAGRPVHVVIAYSPGRLMIYRDGELVRTSDEIQSGFFKWKTARLLFGHDFGGARGWSGRLEGIALYDRLLAPQQVRENFLRYRKVRRERPAVERWVVEARLRAKSAIPTLDEISPYRQALVVFEYDVERVVEGGVVGNRLRVAHWAILGGETLPVTAAAPGSSVRLTLELFGENPQLESHFLSQTLAGDDAGPLYYATSP